MNVVYLTGEAFRILITFVGLAGILPTFSKEVASDRSREVNFPVIGFQASGAFGDVYPFLYVASVVDHLDGLYSKEFFRVSTMTGSDVAFLPVEVFLFAWTSTRPVAPQRTVYSVNVCDWLYVCVMYLCCGPLVSTQ